MSGDLNMGSKEIINIKPFVDNKTNQTGRAIDFSFFYTHRGEIKRLINIISAENLPKDGSESMCDEYKS